MGSDLRGFEGKGLAVLRGNMKNEKGETIWSTIAGKNLEGVQNGKC